MTALATIKVERVGEKVAVSPAAYLGGSFRDYLECVRGAGARFDGPTKRHLLDPTKLEILYRALVRAGFNVENTDEVVSMLRAKASESKVDTEAVTRRIAGKGLFGYQITGATWLAQRDRALLADGMGLGKTVQALMAIPDGAPAIVVCPAIVKGNWARECDRWRPDLSPRVLSGRRSWRWPSAGEVVIVNYDILPDPSDDAKAPQGLVLIADEAHALKSRDAKRTERFKAIGKLVRKSGGRTWLLTGTPLLGKPFDLFGVLSAANLQNDAYGSWQGFLDAFQGCEGPWGGYVFGTPTRAAAEGLERVALRRTKAEVLPDLPSKRRQDILVDIPDLDEDPAVAEFTKWIRDAGFDIDAEWGDEVTAKIDFELLSRARAAIARRKIPAMLEIVEEYEEAEEPLVVFSAHRAPVDELAKRRGWATITGDTSHEQRTEIVEAFQAGRLLGIALTIAAGGVGITLTRASEMLLVDRDWTPALNEQAEDRIHRIGQTRGVLIKRLVADCLIDRRLHQVLSRKQDLIARTVEAAEVAQIEIPKTAAERALEIATANTAADKPVIEREVRNYDASRIPEGAFAIDGDAGHVSFYRVDRPTEGKWKGWTFLRLQHGSEFTRWANISPQGQLTGVAGAATILDRIAADPLTAMRRYGHEIGICGRCARPLTNDESRRLGIGPICLAKMEAGL